MIYDISLQTFDWHKPLRIIFNKVDGIIKYYDGTKYLIALFSFQKYNAIFNRMRYFLSLESDILYVVFYDYEKAKIYSDDDLPLEETLIMYNAVILIQLVFNKNHKRITIGRF